MKKLLVAAGIVAALLSPARAESDYPSKPITWIVPFAAGGVTDTIARKVSALISVDLGQQVIVENKPGAGGVVGTEFAKAAKNDGYTLLYTSSGPMSILPALKGNLSYDPAKDFAHVNGLSISNQLIVANPNAPFKTLAELIDYARANPGKVNFGSPGQGTAQHLAGELLQAAAGIKMTHIPYKAGTNQMVDLMSGVIDLAFDYSAVLSTYIQADKMRLLGTTGSKRLSAYPDAPTVVEAGYPAAENAGWSAVAFPAGTDQAIVDRMSAAIAKALRDPTMVAFYEQTATTGIPEVGPAEMLEFVPAEAAKFKTVIEAAGLAENK